MECRPESIDRIPALIVTLRLYTDAQCCFTPVAEDARLESAPINSAIHKAAGLPATVQIGLHRPLLLPAPIHNLWDIFHWNGGIVPVKPKEWPGTMKLKAL